MMFGNYEAWKKKQEQMAQEAEIVFGPIEVDSVTAWRFGYLVGLGFDPVSALELAEAVTVDLHKADDLVRGKGCPHDVAMRILL